jgi:hypothetical protein
LFALPTDHGQGWRLAAWLVSGVVYAAHIRYEQFKLKNSPRSLGLHVAVATAIGAFALAVAGMVHSLSAASAVRPAWLLALFAWPAFTAIPAFLVAFAAGTVLMRLSRTAST